MEDIAKRGKKVQISKLESSSEGLIYRLPQNNECSVIDRDANKSFKTLLPCLVPRKY